MIGAICISLLLSLANPATRPVLDDLAQLPPLRTLPIAADSPARPADFEDFSSLRESHENDMSLITQSGLNVLLPGSGLILEGFTNKGLPYAALAAGCLVGALQADSTDRGQSIQANLLLVYQNLGFLAAWDCYYSMLERAHRDGYAKGVSRRGLGHYLSSPFGRPAVSWETLMPSGFAFGFGYDEYRRNKSDSPPTGEAIGAEVLLMAQSTMIGTGEELFFRGVLFHELEAWTGSRTLAWILQALTFGLGHINPEETGSDNAAQVAAASTFGLYAGWVTWKRPEGLRKAIAAHMWWDLFVLSFDYLQDGEVEPIILTVKF